MRSKQPIAAAVSGIAVNKIDTGEVNRVITASDVIA
jgi:hypothetical protein